jgi:hypothetical protein
MRRARVTGILGNGRHVWPSKCPGGFKGEKAEGVEFADDISAEELLSAFIFTTQTDGKPDFNCHGRFRE